MLVHDRFPPDYAGGGEYCVLMTARHLQAEGFDVAVICSGNPSQTNFEGIPVKRLPCSPYAFNFKAREVAAYCQGADLIQAFTYHGLRPAVIAGQHLGIPVVNTVLAQFGRAWLTMKGPVLGRLHQALERYLLNLPVAATVYLSDFSLRLANEVSPGQQNKLVIEPGISLEEYAPAAHKDCVFFAGKLEIRKGVGLFLESARELADIPFRMMGWGDVEGFLRQKLPDNVQFTPFTNRRALASALGQARIFVFPTRVETFGLAVAEAMASGCAIVSSSELPFSGIRVPCDDNFAYTRAIAELWHDDSRCSQAALDNIAIAQQYNWNRNISKLTSLYEQLWKS